MIITRLLKNKLYLSIYLLLFIFTKSNQSFSHECILKDTTPKEITIYNTCISQKNSQYNLDAKRFEEMEQNNGSTSIRKYKRFQKPHVFFSKFRNRTETMF